MKLEILPIILGALVALIGICIGFFAVMPQVLTYRRERRRRVRAEPNRNGQLLLGAGTVCMGGALMGRDTWKFANVVVFAGIAMIIAGGVMNRRFLRELLLFRGAARRDVGDQGGNESHVAAPPEERPRIR